MTEFYPEVIPSLQGHLKWELIPRQVDKEALEYRTLLRKQYEKQNPQPDNFQRADSLGEYTWNVDRQSDNGRCCAIYRD